MGLTFDTGALIALERRSARMRQVWDAALAYAVPITVPAPVVVEWWRGQRGPIGRLLDAVHVEPLTEELARIAGAALAATGPGPSVVDAVVMASAAQRGDRVYTADIADLERLTVALPSVRLLRA